MSFAISEFLPALPEIVLAAAACLVLLVDVYVPQRERALTFHLSQGALVLSAVTTIALFPAVPVVALSGTYVADSMSSVLKVFIVLVSYFAVFYTRVYLDARDMAKGEYYVLALFAVLGMMVLVSARSLLTVYLGLELLSLTLYAMVALDRDSPVSSEAAMKYFVLGALASGMLLYGMSLLYGATGSLELTEVARAISTGSRLDVVLVLALVFVVVGVSFKLGAAPFHMWVPDVYEGARTPVTLFIGSAPKMAAFGMLMRLLVDGLEGLSADWSEMLAILAVLSMAVGNVIAIAQTNIKRMLAYSTITHAGFLMLGVIASSRDGYAASMFYAIVYALMSAGAFGMVVALGRSGFEADRLDDFKGLNERSPWLAFLMLILMLSMAGVPPFLGFWAKWSVLQAVVAADRAPLAVVAVVLAVIGLYYYLRVVRLMYFDRPEASEPVPAAADMRVMLSTNALAILALGVYPTGLMALCLTALQV